MNQLGESVRVMHHKKVCNDLNQLYAAKNHDYGDSFHESFVEEGMAMPRIRLGDKFRRFEVLSRSDGARVPDESIRDTLLDLANYAIMTVMEMEDAQLAGVDGGSRQPKPSDPSHNAPRKDIQSNTDTFGGKNLRFCSLKWIVP